MGAPPIQPRRRLPVPDCREQLRGGCPASRPRHPDLTLIPSDGSSESVAAAGLSLRWIVSLSGPTGKEAGRDVELAVELNAELGVHEALTAHPKAGSFGSHGLQRMIRRTPQGDNLNRVSHRSLGGSQGRWPG